MNRKKIGVAHSTTYYRNSNRQLIDKFLLLIICSVALLAPIRWLPGINPISLVYVSEALMLIFIIGQLYAIIKEGDIYIPWPSVILIGILFWSIIFLHINISRSLIVAFGLASVFYFYKHPSAAGVLFRSFTIWIAVLSLFSIIITYTPIPGFELSAPLHPGYNNPVDRFSNVIHINSFGFFAGRGVYTLTAIGFVMAAIYAWEENSKIYFTSSIILLFQLYNIFYLTDSGRAGFVLPIFLLIVLLLKRVGLERWLLFIVFSPLYLWVTIFILRYFISIDPYLLVVDEFMSSRLSLYLDSIQVLISNSRSLIGWGVGPWGQYSLTELGIETSLAPYGETLTRPHNFAFEYFIQFGLLAGAVLMYICWKIVRFSIQEIRQPTTPTTFGVIVFLTGSIFTGLAVGGKIGPYGLLRPQMILWWIGFGTFVGMRSS